MGLDFGHHRIPRRHGRPKALGLGSGNVDLSEYGSSQMFFCNPIWSNLDLWS